MSQIADKAFQALQNLFHDLLGARWLVNGLDLSLLKSAQYDIETLSYAYAAYSALLTDLDCLDLHDAVKFTRRLANVDVCRVARTFKDFDAMLLSLYKDNTDFDDFFSSFKHYSCEKWIQRPFVRLTLELKGDVNRQSFRRLHQAFTFLSRLSLECISGEPDIEDFLARNSAKQSVDLVLARRLSPIIAKTLQGIKFVPWGSHGPGTTADAGRANRTEKSLFLHPDCVHAYAFRKHGWDIEDYMPFLGSSYPADVNRVAKLTTAPKNVLKRRVIAEETVTQQYVQQLVKNALYHHIDDHIPSIPLRDQTLQRKRAQIGSIYGEYATIDLSAASDSVAWELIKSAFRSSGVMHWIYATRTRYVKYKEDVYPLRMYATMGSATCFPIECIVFDAICRLASKDECVPYDCTVYGDDIICPTVISARIISYLQRLGFTVNLDKTCLNYSTSCYRESCGGEYLAGVDVTPLKLPRKFAGLKSVQHHPAVFRSWVDICNGLYRKGFYLARSFMLHNLLHNLSINVRVRYTPDKGRYKGRTFITNERIRIIPAFGTLNESLLTDDAAVNYMLQRRWNKDLQRKELWAPKIATDPYMCKFITRTDAGPLGIPCASEEFLIYHDPRAAEIINHLRYWLWNCDKGRQAIADPEADPRRPVSSETWAAGRRASSLEDVSTGSSAYKGYVCRLEYDWRSEI